MALGVLIPLGIVGYAANRISKQQVALPSPPTPATPAEVLITWQKGGIDGAGYFENVTGAPLPNVALECYVTETNAPGGISTGTERATYHALFLNADKQAQSDWNIRTMTNDMGGSYSKQPRNPPRRETDADRAPLVTIDPGKSEAFYLHKCGTTFPLDIKATSDGRELRVIQKPPRY